MQVVFEEILHHYIDLDTENPEDAEAEFNQKANDEIDLFGGGEVIDSGLTQIGDKPVRVSHIDLEKALYAFLAYVEDDYEGTELSYIREKLTDVCGLSKEECELLGFGWVFTD